MKLSFKRLTGVEYVGAPETIEVERVDEIRIDYSNLVVVLVDGREWKCAGVIKVVPEK